MEKQQQQGYSSQLPGPSVVAGTALLTIDMPLKPPKPQNNQTWVVLACGLLEVVSHCLKATTVLKKI